MTCASCERNRQWIKRQYERSKENMRLCLERLSVKATQAEQSTTETTAQIDRAKQSDSQSKQPTDSD